MNGDTHKDESLFGSSASPLFMVLCRPIAFSGRPREREKSPAALLEAGVADTVATPGFCCSRDAQ